MKKIFSTCLLFVAVAVGANGQEASNDGTENYKYNYKRYKLEFRAGYSIGGTAPLGMPAAIRGLNSFKPLFNLQVGADLERRISDKWGFTAGLRLDRKGMKTDARTKGYHMTMVKGGEAIEGYFYGNVVTQASTWVISIPLQADYWFTKDFKLRLGPYFGLNIDKDFDGWAYDGYLRKDTPNGERIMLGSTQEDRGEYDFGDEMRPLQWGLDLGLDYHIYRGWGLYAELQWGLSSVFKSSFKTIEQKMYPLYGTIGIVKGF